MFIRKLWSRHMDHVLKLHVLKHQHCKQTLHAAKQWVERPIIQQSRPDPTGKVYTRKEKRLLLFIFPDDYRFVPSMFICCPLFLESCWNSRHFALSALILEQITNDVTSIKISFEIPHTETWKCTKGLLLKTQKRTPTGPGFMRMQYRPPCEMCTNSPLLVHWTIEGSNSIWNTAFRALDREAVTNNSYLFSKKLHRSLWGLLINALWINQGEVRDFSESSVSLCYLESHEYGIILVINFSLQWLLLPAACSSDL